MPIYDRGYRRFEGEMSRRFLNFLVIAKSEIQLRFTRKLLLFLLIIPSFLPALIMMIVVYVMLQAMSMEGGAGQTAMMLAQSFMNQVDGGFYFLFFKIHAFVFLLLWGAFVGSDLIANDRKTNALELYFTRPITRFDYLLGKFTTLFFFLLLTTLVPALLLYTFAVLIAPEGAYFEHDSYYAATKVIPKAIVLFSFLQAVVASLVMLALSSMGRSWILIGAIWGGVYLFSRIVYQIVQELSGSPKAVVLSLCDSLLAVGNKLFEIDTGVDNWKAAAIMLAVVSGFSLVILLRKMRVVETVK